jgi:hypothetical protein
MWLKSAITFAAHQVAGTAGVSRHPLSPFREGLRTTGPLRGPTHRHHAFYASVAYSIGALVARKLGLGFRRLHSARASSN